MTVNNLLPKNAKQFFIPGPEGQLDCLELQPNSDSILGIAIIFHPNPIGGGSYSHKIVQIIARVLNQKGYVCYCPNLRGVGMSAGVHDYGNSEIKDAEAVHTYMRQIYPDLPLILAGFSFGTTIASNLASQVKHHKLILVGPSVTLWPVVVSNPSKTIVVHGEEDEIIPIASVLTWGHTHNQPIIWFPNTGHFFHGRLLDLHNLLSLFNLN